MNVLRTILKVIGLIYCLLFTIPFAAHSEEIKSRLLDADVSVVKNTPSEIILQWKPKSIPAESDHRALLFAPGPIAKATCIVQSIVWRNEAGEERVQEEDVTSATTQRKIARSSPYLFESGILDGARIAALRWNTDLLDETNWENTEDPRSPVVTIQIQFNETDPDAFEGFPKDIDPIAKALFLNYPPLLSTERNSSHNTFPAYLSSPGLKVITRDEGIIDLPASRVLPALGTGITLDSIALFRDRKKIPCQLIDSSGKTKTEGIVKAGDMIRFYTPVSSSPYSPEVVTWISKSPGDNLAIRSLSPVSGKRETPVVDREIRLEEDRVFITEKDKNEKQSFYWMWHDFIQDGTKSIEFSLHDSILSSTSSLEIIIGTQGSSFIHLATDSMTAILNDREIPSVVNRSTAGFYSVEASLSPDVLKEGTNRIEINVSYLKKNSDSTRAIYLDRVTIRYSCHARPSNEPYLLSPPNESIVIPSDTSFAYVIRNKGASLNDIWYADGKINAATLPDGESDWKIYYLPNGPRVNSVTVTPVLDISRRSINFSDDRQVDVILIAPRAWEPVIRAHISSLRRLGYTARFTAVEDLYDCFGDGRLSPYAIRDFLRFAYHHWRRPRPSYVLLIGDATWDYWGRYENGVVNYIPAFREHNLYAVEDWFVRCDGDEDTLPDMIIGRWPVRSTEELRRLIAKTIQYKESPRVDEGYNRVFLLTDNGNEFERYSDDLAENWIPKEFRLLRRHIADYPLIDNIYLPARLRASRRAKTSLEATEDIIRILNQGVFLWEFFGHGAPNVIGEHRMFFGGGSKFSDVLRLQNNRVLPILWAFTCETAKFDYPRDKWNISIGEDLLTTPNGGAIALIGATGRGYPRDHHFLAQGMHEAAFHYHLPSIGQQTLAANLMGLARQNVFEPKNQFAILGDPTLAIPQFVSIPGQAERTEEGLAYHWTLPEEIKAATQVTVWTQKERDVHIERQISTANLRNNTVTGLLPIKKGDDIQALGIDVAAVQNRRLTIGHSANLIAATQIAKPLIPAGTDRKCDLTFTVASLVREPEKPRSGETIFFSGTVRNDGEASAENVVVKAYSGTPTKRGTELRPVVGPIGAEIERIDPGEEIPVRIRWDPSDNAGRHTAHLAVDPNQKIRESNEKNNSIATTFYVLSKADLIVNASKVEVTPIDNGKRLNVFFEIVNQGESRAENAVLQFELKLPGSPLQTAVLTRLKKVDPDERVPAGGIKIPANLEYFELVIDPDEIVDEETHENNRFRYTPTAQASQ